MKNFFIFLFTILLALPLRAQYQERTLVSASGFQGVAAGYFMEYSLGEPVVGTFSSGGYTALVGFHQPPLAPSTGIPLIKGKSFIKTYPIPTRSSLNVEWDAANGALPCQLSLTDMRGVNLMSLNGQVLSSNPITLSLHSLQPGIYFLRVVFNDGSWQVIKVSLIK